MDSKNYIKKPELIGKRVRSVFSLHLGFEEENQFYVFVIELESGLRFALERETGVIDPLTDRGLIYPYLPEQDMFEKKACDIDWNLKRELDASTKPDLNSPIQAVFLPHGAKYFCGLLLENGFVICDGLFPWGNVLAFHKPKYGLGPDDAIIEMPED